MKVNQVPQQDDSIYEGVKKIVYAVNDTGQLIGTQSKGWEAETDSLKNAIATINQQAQSALKKAQLGTTSTLEYHMHHQRLDVAMLANAMGKFQWQVRRHFQPKVFNALPYKILQQYADIMNISVKQLKTLP